MKSNHIPCFLLCASLLLLCFCTAASGENSGPRPELSNSMSYYEVVKLWGAPQEKHELEAKRQDIWIYSDYKVIFSQGKVVAWINTGAAAAPLRTAKNPGRNTIEGFGDTLNGGLAAEAHEEEVEEILRDIMDESPEAAVPQPPAVVQPSG